MQEENVVFLMCFNASGAFKTCGHNLAEFLRSVSVLNFKGATVNFSNACLNIYTPLKTIYFLLLLLDKCALGRKYKLIIYHRTRSKRVIS